MSITRTAWPEGEPRPPLMAPCPTCAATGDHSHDDGHRDNRKDTCTTCGGTREIPAATGQTPATSFRADDPGAA